jgi:putative two-component system response regulator
MNKKEETFILVVDDDPYVRGAVSTLLKEYGYWVIMSENGVNAMSQLHENKIDVVLTDIKMPGISGIELLERIRDFDSDIPVILMTGYAELDIAIDAVKKNAFDFITKPYKLEYLIHTIEKAVKYKKLVQVDKNYRLMLEDTVKIRTQELSNALTMITDMSKEVIKRLTAVAEFRDTDTGTHISRIGFYSKKIAEVLNLPENFVELTAFASPMHDIGKVGIPDRILLKQASLTEEEFEIMKTHTTIGGKILSGSSYPSIKMAASVALTHHEKWDGSGYPLGLKGKDIPIEGRIVMFADQYDALRSKRPYRRSLSHEETFKILTEGDGRTMPGHFDPDILRVFLELDPGFDDIFSSHRD